MTSFLYTTGGTVQAGGGLYVSRKADQELLELCRKGEFAYVLTPRQMGKSSLMIETARALKEEGTRSAVIDLNQIGTAATADQWYLSVLHRIGQRLRLSFDVHAWWQSQTQLSTVDRLTRFFEEKLLAEVSERVVIFVDEIDATLALDFTDDFYAAIRYLYLERAQEQSLERLSFVLIGTATPSDLIRDPRRTPFNIGRRVDLDDFTLDEARELAGGLGLVRENAAEVLRWIFEWTHGHPYLTQRVCWEIVEKKRGSWQKSDIKDLIAQIFLGKQDMQDHNLLFVRDMLSEGPQKTLAEKQPSTAGQSDDLEVAERKLVTEVLRIYQRVLQRRAVTQSEKSSIAMSRLRLSGVIRSNNGALSVRNVIYRQVFDMAWVKEAMPISEVQEFFRRWGATLAVGAVFVAALSFTTGWAWISQQQAQQASAKLQVQLDTVKRFLTKAVKSRSPSLAFEATAELRKLMPEDELSSLLDVQHGGYLGDLLLASPSDMTREEEIDTRIFLIEVVRERREKTIVNIGATLGAAKLLARAGKQVEAERIREVLRFEMVQQLGPPPEPAWSPIPDGTFWMGCSKNDERCQENEKPRQEVTISSFQITRSEITIGQVRRFVMNKRRAVTPEARLDPDELQLPVTNVNWYEAMALAAWMGGRLPTEAEWEYAARGGTQTPWWSGDDIEALSKTEWYVANSNGELQPVCSQTDELKHPWDLCDVQGNAFEWVFDWYGPYPVGMEMNYDGPRSGTDRVVRGGLAVANAEFTRVSNREFQPPNSRAPFVGFRLVRDIPDER